MVWMDWGTGVRDRSPQAPPPDLLHSLLWERKRSSDGQRTVPARDPVVHRSHVTRRHPPSFLMINTMERKIKLKSLNPHISCKICKGYLIDATTVTECLHTFCKSCLIKHLEEKNTCPSCQIVIHQSHPLNYISYDRTMQDIVYKLAPNLQQNEVKREKEFYKKRGLPYPKANAVQNQEKDVVRSFIRTSSNNNNNNNRIENNCVNGDNNHIFAKEEKSDCHRSDEQINILIENLPGSNLKSVKRKFIRCSAHTTVTHIKKFVAKKLFNNYDRYKEIDILCEGQSLGKDHTLKFIFVTKWRFREPPLKLTYKPQQGISMIA